MKKLLVITLFLTILMNTSGQSVTLSTFKDKFDAVATDAAASLPMNAAVGLNWADPYIGQLFDLPPHFGVGLTAGVTTMPYDSVKAAVAAMGGNTAKLEDLARTGVPIPAFAIDGRIGGIILPFDFGLKVGIIPAAAKEQLSKDFKVDYTLVGFDVRVPVLKQFFIIPEVSVGGGFNYMKGNLAMSGFLPAQTITSIHPSYPLNMTLTAPNLILDWENKTLDLKAQAGWSLFILDFGVGAGLSYGMSTVKGGLESTLLYGGQPISMQPGLIAILKSLGYTIDDTKILFGGDKNGVAFRLMANLSVNILLLRVDGGLMFNPASRTMGATIGARVQL